MIQYIEETAPPVKLEKRKINNWIKNTAAKYGCNIGNIAYIFCSDERILEINRQYLQHDYYTDIITFDDSVGCNISGDMFISIDTVVSNAQKFGTDVVSEFYRVLIHGVLHLCGQDDKTTETQKEMTRKENEALADFLSR